MKIKVQGIFANRTQRELLGTLTMDISPFLGMEKNKIDAKLLKPKYQGSKIQFELSIILPKEFLKQQKQIKKNAPKFGNAKLVDQKQHEIVKEG